MQMIVNESHQTGELVLYADMANGLIKLERHAQWKGKETVVFALSKNLGGQLSRLLIQSSPTNLQILFFLSKKNS